MRQSVPRRADTHRARSRVVAGAASSNGRSVSDSFTNVLEPSCHTVLVRWPYFGSGVYNRTRLGKSKVAPLGGSRLDKLDRPRVDPRPVKPIECYRRILWSGPGNSVIENFPSGLRSSAGAYKPIS